MSHEAKMLSHMSKPRRSRKLVFRHANDTYGRAFKQVMELGGFDLGECRLCGEVFYVEFKYQELGVCSTCVCHLAHEWHMQHVGGPSDAFSSREQIAAYQERSIVPGRRGYQKAEIPHRLRKQVMERDAYRCKHCGDHHDLQIDHVYPESKGGPTTLENLQVLCRPCNSKKGVTV